MTTHPPAPDERAAPEKAAAMNTIDDVVRTWPHLTSRTAVEWSYFALALQARNQRRAAAILALATQERSDADGEARRIAANVIGQGVPSWHWGIVADDTRNRLYDTALRQAITPGDRVLDIGTGSGLLAMMAARAGAGSVLACEMNTNVATLAERVIADNGLAQTVRVVPRHSQEIRLGQDMDDRVDVIVSEIVSNDLLSQDVLAVHRDVVGRLLRDGGHVIPRAISAMAALARIDDLDQDHMAKVSGFDLGAFNRARKPIHLPVGSDRITLCSEPAALFSFDLARPRSWPDRRTAASLHPTRPGANAILSWIRMDMDGSGHPAMVYENRPGQMAHSCWSVLVWPIGDAPLDPSRPVELAGIHTETTIDLWRVDDGVIPGQERHGPQNRRRGAS